MDRVTKGGIWFWYDGKFNECKENIEKGVYGAYQAGIRISELNGILLGLYIGRLITIPEYKAHKNMLKEMMESVSLSTTI